MTNQSAMPLDVRAVAELPVGWLRLTESIDLVRWTIEVPDFSLSAFMLMSLRGFEGRGGNRAWSECPESSGNAQASLCHFVV